MVSPSGRLIQRAEDPQRRDSDHRRSLLCIVAFHGHDRLSGIPVGSCDGVAWHLAAWLLRPEPTRLLDAPAQQANVGYTVLASLDIKCGLGGAPDRFESLKVGGRRARGPVHPVTESLRIPISGEALRSAGNRPPDTVAISPQPPGWRIPIQGVTSTVMVMVPSSPRNRSTR